jgi:hypothetical protein
VHAKLLIAEGNNFDHVLSGSLNCSRAAMLSNSGWPYNSECGIYRRVAKRTAVKLMGLKPCFVSALTLEDLPDFSPPADDNQLNLRYIDGGCLFLKRDRLIWKPSNLLDDDPVGVFLMGPTLPDQLVKLDQQNGERIARVPEGYHTPITARIIFGDKTESSPVAICNMNVLPVRSQPVGGRKVQNQLSALELLRSEDLEMIDILFRLEHMQRDEDTLVRPLQKRPRLTTQIETESEFKEFTYAAFLENRINNVQSATASGESIFADQYVSDVSRVLNRILGIVAPVTDISEDDDMEDLRPTEHTHEDDVLSDNFVSRPEKKHIPEDIISRQSQRHTVEMLLAAIARYTEARRQANQEDVSITDLIHLRALLQIILAFSAPMNMTSNTTYVLPPFDKLKPTGWPRLIGKILAAFFGRNQNPIANLKIPETADTIPNEIVDCWACIDVAARLSASCASQFEETAFIAGLLEKLSIRATTCIEQSINHFPDAKDRFDMMTSQFILRFEHLP